MGVGDEIKADNIRALLASTHEPGLSDSKSAEWASFSGAGFEAHSSCLNHFFMFGFVKIFKAVLAISALNSTLTF